MSDFPDLPVEVPAASGPVAVLLAPVAGEGKMGSFDPSARTITVDSELPRHRQWWVLYHELVHVALWDSGGANLMKSKVQEAVCDGIATARMRERFG
jgi:Zn-dependent peptidase ImmA (M78 family)